MAYYNSSVTQEVVTLKNSSGLLERVIVNKKGTSGATLILYDSTSDSGNIIGTLRLDTCDTYIDYDLEFLTGLTIKTSNSSCDLTVVYK
jgi:hypothetical protein